MRRPFRMISYPMESMPAERRCLAYVIRKGAPLSLGCSPYLRRCWKASAKEGRTRGCLASHRQRGRQAGIRQPGFGASPHGVTPEAETYSSLTSVPQKYNVQLSTGCGRLHLFRKTCRLAQDMSESGSVVRGERDPTDSVSEGTGPCQSIGRARGCG